jgi:hypothetical protein
LDLHAAVDANEDSAMLSFREWCHDHTLEIAVFALRVTPPNSIARGVNKGLFQIAPVPSRTVRGIALARRPATRPRAHTRVSMANGLKIDVRCHDRRE